MNNQFLLQIVAIATGGGLVQMLIFLLRRRAEIRSLDRGSDAGLLVSANELIAKHQSDSMELRKEVVRLRSELDDTRTAMTAMQANHVRQLDLAHEVSRRLTIEVAQLRVELDIATTQLNQLRTLRRPPGG